STKLMTPPRSNLWIASYNRVQSFDKGGKKAGVPSPIETGALETALTRVGDRWTLLVINALLDGPRRFNELQDDLAGIATNVLSQRLKHLERAGVVLARPYSTRPLRHAYELTAAGRELVGALRLLTRWGADPGDAAAAGPRHEACGTPLEPR